MALKLKSVKRDSQDHLIATYEVEHTTPGSTGTTLSLDLTLNITPAGQAEAGMAIQGPACASTDEALDRLAEWLERSGEAIRKRPKNFTHRIPVYPE